jgi:uncharacterized membrane protein
MVVYLLISWAIGFIAGVITASPHGGGLATLIAFPFDVLLSLGLTAFMIKAHDAVETIRIADLWHPHQYVNYLLAYLLIAISAIVGIILLIVPGIIIGIMFGFSCYLVVDRGLGPIEAIKESMRITKGHRWDLFVFVLACLGIMILGFICLFVGILAALPIVMIAGVHAYRTLSKIAEVPPSPVV